MTTSEFKIKYPHLAHLEGNDLWNAMEDSYIYEHRNDVPEKIVDWKGNEIKDGDEICFIKFLERDYYGKAGMFMPDGKGGGETHWFKIEPNPDKECWEVGEYLKVEMKGNIPYVTTKLGEYTFTQPISMMLFSMNKDCSILAIKGISDTPEK